MIKGQLPGSREVDVEDDSFGRRDEDFVNEFLVLVMAAVCAYELHLCARDCDVEDARVRGVRQVETNDLTPHGCEGKVWFACDEHDVSEPAHRDVSRLGLAERRQLPVFDQDVIQGKEQLAVRGRPIVRLGGRDEDVAV